MTSERRVAGGSSRLFVAEGLCARDIMTIHQSKFEVLNRIGKTKAAGDDMRFVGRKQLEDAIMRDKSELISQFYPIKDGQLQLSFAGCDELLDQNLAGGGTPRLKTEVFGAIDRALLNFKSDTITKLAIRHPSDSSFTAEMFAEVLHQNMRLRLLELIIESRKNRRICLNLFAGGCLLLALSYLLGEIIASDVVFDVINILGSLLIWTAGENHFLAQAQNRRLRRKYALLIKGGAAEWNSISRP